MSDKLEWQAQAANVLTRWAKRQHKPFTIEQARIAIGEKVGEAKDLRWWGAVTLELKRRGILRPTGKTRPARSSHYSDKPTYTGC